MTKKMYTYHFETVRAENLPVTLAQNGNLGNRLASALERPDGTLLLIFEYEVEMVDSGDLPPNPQTLKIHRLPVAGIWMGVTM